MKYVAGDLLLKVDTRSYAETRLTRHHVMLVVGESEDGHPIVIHMVGKPHYSLVKENLQRGKELTHLHAPFTDALRETIKHAAEISLKSQLFKLNPAMLDEQSNAVSAYRPRSPQESGTKLGALCALFTLSDTFKPHPDATTEMTCHEWVMSIIHYACRINNEIVPKGWAIPPSLAWADRLYEASYNDGSIALQTVSFAPGSAVEMPTSQLLLLSNPACMGLNSESRSNTIKYNFCRLL